MNMKKVLLSTIAMAMFFAGSLGLFILVACSGPKPATENEAKKEQVETVVPVEEEIDTDNLAVLAEEEPSPVAPAFTPARKETYSNNYSSSSSYSSSYSDDSEEEGDYWSEKRKHSPNDNYLLGFDEDVDDVHDMELYIEDY